MTVNEAVRDLLRKAKPDAALDGLVREAERKGLAIGRNTIAKARRGELARPKPETVEALSALFGVDVRLLRSAIGWQPGELGPYVPDERSASLTQNQRDALDKLIVTIVEQGGQTDDRHPSTKKSPSPGGGKVIGLPTGHDGDEALPTAARPEGRAQRARREQQEREQGWDDE